MRIGSVIVAGVLLCGAGWAAAAPAAVPPKSAAAIELLLGGDQWQPGRHYRTGSDWLALACTKTDCRFEPARLAVRRERWQGHYDNEPTDGQKLTLRRQKPGPGSVLAWFRLDPRQPWLRAGPVVTYGARSFRLKRPASEGTLEVAIDLPGGEQARLVPLYDTEGQRFVLQLRTTGRRQLLDELGACSRAVGLGYFVWAGDLDGDGRPDYLIDFADAVGEAKLYLGRDAGPDELAGVAAVYVPPPFGGECDGSGWLPR